MKVTLGGTNECSSSENFPVEKAIDYRETSVVLSVRKVCSVENTRTQGCCWTLSREESECDKNKRNEDTRLKTT